MPAPRRGVNTEFALDDDAQREVQRTTCADDRARELEAAYGLEFLRFVEVLKRLNPHTEKRLLV